MKEPSMRAESFSDCVLLEGNKGALNLPEGF